MSSGTDGKYGRLDWVDGLRGLAAIIVVFHHYFWLHTPGFSILSKILDPGALGVAVFFHISGYVIPFSIRGRSGGSVSSFAISRFFRLYPAYWVSLVLAGIVYGGSLRLLAANATMMQRFIGFPDLVGVYWTLAVELLFYFFTALTLATGSFGSAKVTLSAGVISGLCGVALGMVRYFLHVKAPISVPLGLSLIFVGNAYFLWRKGTIAKKAFLPFAATIYALVALTCILGDSRNWQYHEEPGRFIMSYMYASILFFTAARYHWSTSRVLLWLGSISYSLYLLHLPLRDLALNMANGRPLVATVVALVTALASSYAVYRIVERPGISLGKAIRTAALARGAASTP